MTITSEEMRGKMLTLPTVRKRLGKYEPLDQVTFPLNGPKSSVAKFKLGPEWNLGLENIEGTGLVDAYVTVGGNEYALTKDALLEASSAIGVTKQYMSKTPANLMAPHMNYWFANKPGEMKLLLSKSEVMAVAKGSIEPFSNLALIDRAVDSIKETYSSDDIMVDYKFWHSLRTTSVRLVVPEVVRNPRKDDPWSAGIEIRNSLVGEHPLELKGYLFRWECTNGATSTHAESGKWNRRTGGQGDEVYEWARAAVDGILGGLEHEFEALEELASQSFPEEDMAETLADVFMTYKVPLDSREAITDNMVNSTDMTMYGVQAAITEAANDMTISEPIRRVLLEIGGDIPLASTNRCKACKRLMPS